jgi:dATP pyrophosphohydrolase
MRAPVSAKVILLNNANEILLLRRSDNDRARPREWDLVGGGVDGSEHPAEAAARETLEETNIKLSPSDFRIVYGMTEKVADDASATWIYFLANAPSNIVFVSHEHSEYTWVSIEKALQMLEYERQKRAIQYVKDNNLLTAEVG